MYIKLERQIMKKTKMVRTDLYITQRQYDTIHKEAKERGTSFAERFRQIIENYLDNKK